jgi:SAM-dependent methyltransferase
VRGIETNRKVWDERTAIHVGSAWYDVEGFKQGRCSLRSVELGEVGDVTGKRLLHLQCHFGLDTLSWARRGAKVTGVDFSPEAIAIARRLADEVHLDAEFVCSDVNDLPRALDGLFDIVFTSYGVLAWLPDLVRWAEVIARFLDDGGTFYIVEKHPLSRALVEEEGKLVAAKPYLDVGPIVVRSERTYADSDATLTNDTYCQWRHSLGDVINALTGAGLRIEFLHEFPFSLWHLRSMVQSEDGWWRLSDRDDLPLMFSLRARKQREEAPSE